MAETQGGETIRSMVSGFNAMQAQLGLLPVQGGNQPLGVALPPPPPPPPIQSPAEVSVQANQLMQAQTQQTIQAAQMTRYAPPPSSPPMGGGGMSVGGMGGMGGMNPFVAQALGGGGGGALGMPNPMMMMAPQYGGYRPGSAGAPPYLNPGHAPSPLNPFAIQPPSPHFGLQYQQDYSMMQGQQAAMSGFAASKVQGGIGLAGSVVGGVLGSAFGPLGTMAGSYLGGKVAGGVSNFVFGSAMSDMERGRNIQNMTSPYMVGGASLNTFTGQGMDRESAQRVAEGLRTMTRRDHVFERQTGFNNADIRKITQLASDQGMLETAQDPDDITRKVKQISKSVKLLMQISGDPDVRKAIGSIGKMKNLGFEGLAGQLGAAAQTTEFSRMAGVSSPAMQQMYGMPGAMTAQQMGLVGATGYQAGMMGGAMANMAVGAGAFTDLQKARGGGRQGIAQSNMMAMLGAVNRDEYLAAALTRNEQGELSVDMKAYKQAQGMAFGDVARMAQDNINSLGRKGIEEYKLQKGELKDQLAQQMGPVGMQMNFAKQVLALKKDTGQETGAAIYSLMKSSPMGRGMSEEQLEATSRSLELQITNRGFYDAQKQQLEVSRRRAIDVEQRKLNQYRTPGLMTRMGEGITDFAGGISDSVTGWGRENIFQPLERAAEERAAQKRGEHITRYRGGQIMRTDKDREWALAAMNSQRFRTSSQGRLGGDGLDEGILSRNLNILGTGFGLSSHSTANRIATIASESESTIGGYHPLGAFRDTSGAMKRIEDVTGVAEAIEGAESKSTEKYADEIRLLQQRGTITGAKGRTGKGFSFSSMMTKAYKDLRKESEQNEAGRFYSGAAIGEGSYKRVLLSAAKAEGMEGAEAERYVEENLPALMEHLATEAGGSGDRQFRERMVMSKDVKRKMGGVSLYRDRKDLEADVKQQYKDLGISKFSDETRTKMKKTFQDLDEETMRQLVIYAAKDVGGDDRDKGEAKAQELNEAEIKRLMKTENISREDAEVRVGASRRKAIAVFDAQERWVKKGIQGLGMKVEAGNWSTLDERLAQGFGSDMGAAAQKNFVEQVSTRTGDKKLANETDLVKFVQGLNIKDDDKGLSKVRELQKKLNSGELEGQEAIEAVNKLAVDWGPKSRVERQAAGGSGTAVRSIEAKISEMETLANQLAKEKPKDTGAQLQAESSMLIADAAKNLNEAADKIGIIVTGNRYQGQYGP